MDISGQGEGAERSVTCPTHGLFLQEVNANKTCNHLSFLELPILQNQLQFLLHFLLHFPDFQDSQDLGHLLKLDIQLIWRSSDVLNLAVLELSEILDYVDFEVFLEIPGGQSSIFPNTLISTDFSSSLVFLVYSNCMEMLDSTYLLAGLKRVSVLGPSRWCLLIITVNIALLNN